jgi:hypothetical protein
VTRIFLFVALLFGSAIYLSVRFLSDVPEGLVVMFLMSVFMASVCVGMHLFRGREDRRDNVRFRYVRIGAHATLSDHDHRGPLNRAQAMLYSDPGLTAWREVPGGGVPSVEEGGPEERTLVVSHALFSILVSPAVRLIADPKAQREKMVHIAKTNSVVNISVAQDAELGIVVNTVNLAFSYIHGYVSDTRTRVYPIERLDPLNVVVPERY